MRKERKNLRASKLEDRQNKKANLAKIGPLYLHLYNAFVNLDFSSSNHLMFDAIFHRNATPNVFLTVHVPSKEIDLQLYYCITR